MMRYIDQGKTGDIGVKPFVLTISIIFLAYILGSFGLSIDYSFHETIGDGTGLTMDHFVSILGKNRVLFWLMFPFIVVFVAFLLAIKYIHKRSIRSVFTARDSFDWKRVFISFFLINQYLGV